MELIRERVARDKVVGKGAHGEIYLGDARFLMPELIEKNAEKVTLAYLDPPFMTGKKYEFRARVGAEEWKSGNGTLSLPAYADPADGESYMDMMRAVLSGVRELLSPRGSLFLHVDYRAHARMKLLLDELFGERNFVNEIIWAYQSGGRSTRYFSRKHDVILFYSKTADYKFNCDEVALPREGQRRNHMKREIDPDGRAYRSIYSAGKLYKYYDDEPVVPGDVWTDVSHLQQRDPRRTGYDTQKPDELLRRIILCASDPGDVVCDLFAGSGTTPAVAHALGRGFLSVDMGEASYQVTRARLAGANAVCHAPSSEGSPKADITFTPRIADYLASFSSFALEDGLLEGGYSGLDAAQSWSVGYLEGDEYVEYASSERSRKSPELADELQLPMLGGRPCARVCDVYSRRFYYALPERQEATT